MTNSESRIHLTVYICTKKGLTSSYIEVTAHYLNIQLDGVSKKAEMESCVLELIEFESLHTGHKDCSRASACVERLGHNGASWLHTNR